MFQEVNNKMIPKKFVFLFLLLFLLSSVSANQVFEVSAYPGETISINNPLKTSDLEINKSGTEYGINISITKDSINMALPGDMPPCSFVFVFSGNVSDGSNESNNSGESVSGSGNSVSMIFPLWDCGEWSECEDGTKERTCVDLRDYFSDRTETKNCSIDSELGSNSYEDKGMSNVEDLDSSSNVGSNTGDSKGFFQRITGEVIGEGDEKNRNLGFLGVFLVIIILFLVLMRKKQRK